MPGLLVALVLVLLALPASAAEPYVEAGVLAFLPLNTSNDDKIESRKVLQPGAEVAIGARLTPWLRSDVSLAWRQWDIHGYREQSADGDVNTISLGVGAWLNASWIYIGSAVGPALELIDGSRGSQDGRRRDDTELEFGYEAGAGVRVPLGRVLIDVGYRYFATTGETEGHGPRLALAVPLS